MFKIGNRVIDSSLEPYIIAELSANHNGSLARAKLSIKTAKECGAHAIKIQTYTPDTMTIDSAKSDFLIKGGPWEGYKLYDLYNKAFTPFEWHAELFRYARELGVTLFSTPFDETAVDLLEQLNTPAYKIASFELIDLPLISYVAKTRKPLIISTGMASEREIGEALETARSQGCNSLLLLHCISSYPAPVEQANLKQLANLKKVFGVSVGLSDHTIGNISAITAIALGACAIEKHFTLSRLDHGPDSEFSIEPMELTQLIRDTRDAWRALGAESFVRPTAELTSLVFRRSLYFVRDVEAGKKIEEMDVRRIRPGFGLSPKHLNEIIGKIAALDIKRGDPVTWDAVRQE